MGMVVLWACLERTDAIQAQKILVGGTVVVPIDNKHLEVVSDKVILTLVLNDVVLNTTYNKVLDKLFNLKESLNNITNPVLNNLIEKVTKRDMVIKSFLKFYREPELLDIRQKRQAFFGGLAIGLLTTLGLSQVQVSSLSAKVHSLNDEHLHTAKQISMLESIIKLHDDKINKVIDYTNKAVDTIKISYQEINSNFNKINKEIDSIKLDLSLLYTSVTLDRLFINLDKIMGELKYLFNGQINRNMLSTNLKNKICNQIKNSGHLVLGGCMSLDEIHKLVTVVPHYSNSNMLFLISIPVKRSHEVDQFKLMRIITLPLNVGNKAMRLDVGQGNDVLGIGDKFLVNVNYDECISTENCNICVPTSSYMRYQNAKTCVAAILRNDSVVYEFCNFRDQKQSDIFHKFGKAYYYSVVEKRNIEVICKKARLNTNFTLSQMGVLILKEDCIGKSYNILLEGSKNFKINESLHIDFKQETLMTNIHNSSIFKLDIINVEKLNELVKVSNKSLLSLMQNNSSMPAWSSPSFNAIFQYTLAGLVVFFLSITSACWWYWNIKLRTLQLHASVISKKPTQSMDHSKDNLERAEKDFSHENSSATINRYLDNKEDCV